MRHVIRSVENHDFFIGPDGTGVYGVENAKVFQDRAHATGGAMAYAFSRGAFYGAHNMAEGPEVWGWEITPLSEYGRGDPALERVSRPVTTEPHQVREPGSSPEQVEQVYRRNGRLPTSVLFEEEVPIPDPTAEPEQVEQVYRRNGRLPTEPANTSCSGREIRDGETVSVGLNGNLVTVVAYLGNRVYRTVENTGMVVDYDRNALWTEKDTERGLKALR